MSTVVKRRRFKEPQAERPKVAENAPQINGRSNSLQCEACGAWTFYDPEEPDLLCAACSVKAENGVIVCVDGEWKAAELPSLAAEFRDGLPSLSNRRRHDDRTLSTATPSGIAIHAEDVAPPVHKGGVSPATEEKNRRNGRRPQAMLPDDWKIKIDPEFRDLLDPLDPIELEKLRTDLLAHGCLDPLIVWRCTGHMAGLGDTHPAARILLDGHNRYQICYEHRIPVEIVELEFSNRAEALTWMRDHQVGRRNLSIEKRNELLARDYAAEIERRKNGQKEKGQKNGKAAAVVAKKHDVSPATVKRAVQTDRARDAIAKIVDRPRQQLPAMTDDEAKTLAKLPRHQIHEAVRRGTTAIETLVKSFKATTVHDTVVVPFSKGEKCKASFVIVEQDGRWFHFENSSNARGGGVTSYSADDIRRGEGLSGLEIGQKFRSREACLQAAAKDIERMAVAQGNKCWPPTALKVIREWRASLPQPGARKKTRAKADRELREEATKHIERYLDTIDPAEAAWQQSDYLLDAINLWRSRRKGARTMKAAKTRRPKPR